MYSMTFKEIFSGERPLKWVSMLAGLAVGLWLIFYPDLHTLPVAALVVIPFATIMVVENILRFFEWVFQGRTKGDDQKPVDAESPPCAHDVCLCEMTGSRPCGRGHNLCVQCGGRF